MKKLKSTNPIIGSGLKTLSKIKDGMDAPISCYFELTNDSHTVPYLEDGTGGNYIGCETVANFYIGNALETGSEVTYSIEENSVVGKWIPEQRKYIVSKLIDDVAYVDIKAVYQNEKFLARFSLSKVFNGKDSYSMNLTNDTHVFSSDYNGVLAANVVATTDVILYKGNELASFDKIVMPTQKPPGMQWQASGSTVTITALKGSELPLDGEIIITAMIGTKKYKKSFHWTKIREGRPGLDGSNGVAGEDGVSIIWKGSFPSHIPNAKNGWAYYNTKDKKSYVFQSNSWYQMTIDGTDGVNGNKGEDGLSIDFKGEMKDPPSNPKKNWTYKDTDNGIVYIYTGIAWEIMTYDGTNGTNGTNGANGVSIVFKGSFASHPSNPKNGWSYYNTKDKKSYVFQSNSWYQMTIDGIDGIDGNNGKDGKDGLSIEFKGELKDPPSNPKKNWTYKDTDNGIVYIYTGVAWEVLTYDGTDGIDGANGQNGLSVFITYNDSASAPSTPVGNGTTNGWHTNSTNTSVWMSQKVAASATSGSWGTPIKIKGNQGVQGIPGTNGINGTNGTTTYTWVKYADNAAGGGMSDYPDNKKYLGMAYNKVSPIESNIASEYAWSLIKGTDGQPGQTGANGQTYYTWMKYSDSPTSGMSDSPINKKYIGIAVNKTTATESTNYSDYTWSLIKGADGSNGVDGSDGLDGSNGVDGLSVFITYHDSTSTPATPTGNGTSGGWHTNSTTNVIWMSQKISSNSTSGTWGAPIKIKGNTGNTGATGPEGPPGSDAQVPEWIKDWTSGHTVINDELILAGKIFAGNGGTSASGVAIGKNTVLNKTSPGLALFSNGTPVVQLFSSAQSINGESGVMAQFGTGSNAMLVKNNGEVRIPAGLITGQITADQINGNGLYVSGATTITGTLSADKISGGTIIGIDISGSTITGGSINLDGGAFRFNGGAMMQGFGVADLSVSCANSTWETYCLTVKGDLKVTGKTNLTSVVAVFG